MFSCGIIGLPNVGKSTIFNALTKADAEVAAYPFCTIEPNVGILAVPDERLCKLGQLLNPEKLTQATIELVDVAGLVKGASMGEGLGNEFLGHIQQVDAMAHVVRLFRDDDIAHEEGTLDPPRDIRTVNTELLMKDIERTGKRLEDARKHARTGGKEAEKEKEFLEKILKELEAGTFINELAIEPDEMATVREMGLLTVKPVIYIGNVSEQQALAIAEGDDDTLGKGTVADFKSFAEKNKLIYTFVCAELECELAELGDVAEAALFLSELGLKESGLEKIVKMAYQALGLITFFTVKGPETRAWELPEGSTAPEAAGKIHTDMQHGFIRAEVTLFDKLMEAGSFLNAREKGYVRTEGKEYIVKDGDVMLFRFKA